MVYVICPSCGTVGYRISTKANFIAVFSPPYRGLNQRYKCSICGDTLRKSSHREFNMVVVAGGETGA